MTEVDESLYETESRTYSITVEDENGDPIPVAEATYIIYENAEVPIVTKEIGSGIQVTDKQSGEIAVNISSNDTDGKSGVHNYALQVVDDNGNTSVPLVGNFTINSTPF